MKSRFTSFKIMQQYLKFRRVACFLIVICSLLVVSLISNGSLVEPIKRERAELEIGQLESNDGKAASEVHIPQLKTPMKLLILGYQRTASSIISTLLGELPGHFFMFEPGDFSFTAMYGTMPNKNIPSDIFNTPGGDIREADSDEVAALQWTLDSVFQCKMADHWPLPFLVHQYWFNTLEAPTLKAPYIECLQSYDLRYKVKQHILNKCHKELKDICGDNFDSSSHKQRLCKKVFWKNGRFATGVDPAELLNGTNYGFDKTEMKLFHNFFQCLKPYEATARACARKWLDQKCQNSSILVVKTVRASMDIAEGLLKDDPKFRLVHLFRDPRGATFSRFDKEWTHGIYDLRNLSRIARVYCQNILHDYRMRRNLESEYPNQIAQILSDDFMLHPFDYVEHMAKFIHKNVTVMKSLLTTLLSENGIEVEESDDHTEAPKMDTEEKDNPGGEPAIGVHLLRRLLSLRDHRGPLELSSNSDSSDQYASFYQRRTLLAAQKGSPVSQEGIGLDPKPPGPGIAPTTPAVTGPKQGTARLNKWQGGPLHEQAEQIKMECKEFFKEIKYNWEL